MNKINQHTHVLFAYVNVTGEIEKEEERKRAGERERERGREREGGREGERETVYLKKIGHCWQVIVLTG